MQTVASPPTNEEPAAAGLPIPPERVKHSLPSTRRSSRTLMRRFMTLPSLAPASNIRSFLSRVKSSPSASVRKQVTI